MIHEGLPAEDAYYCTDNNGWYTKEWFLRREIVCGKKTKQLMRKIGSSHKIKDCVWKRNHLILTLEDSKNRIIIARYIKQKESLYKRYAIFERAGDCVILFNGERKFYPVVDNISKNIRKVNMYRIFKTIFLDKNIIISSEGRIQDHDFPKKKFSYFLEWGSNISYFWFMAPDLIKKCKVPSYLNIQYDNSLQIIYHADYECVEMCHDRNFPLNQKSIPFVYIKERNDKEHARLFLEEGRQTVKSILYDTDIIFGGYKTLLQALDQVSKKNKDTDILITSACTPYIIGDDVELYAKKHAHKGNVMYKNPFKSNLYEAYIEEVLTKISNQKVKKTKKFINLVGYSDTRDSKEIVSLLDMLGVTVHKAPLPDISQLQFRDYLKAPLQVLFPDQSYEWIYQRLFSRINIKTIQPAAPFGIIGTDGWLQCILNFYRMNVNISNLDIIQEKKARFRNLQKQANKYTIGIVLSKEDILRMSGIKVYDNSIRINPIIDTEQVPMIPLLSEMGFQLEVAVTCRKQDYITLKNEIYSSVHDKKRLNVSYVIDKDIMDDWLQKERIDAIYSDFVGDSRIIDKGKNVISNQLHIEMGYEGAIRSLVKIIAICENKFNNRYAKYFGNEAVPVEVKL